MKKTTTSGEAASPDISIGWTYDADGRLTSEVYDYGNDDANTGGKTADDYTDTYAYDGNGNRITKTYDQGNDGTIDQTLTDTYDSENRLTFETDHGGYNTTYIYDSNGSPTSIKKLSQTNFLLRWDIFSYDARGRALASNARVNSPPSLTTTTYKYDDEGNVISASTYVGSDPSTAVLTTYLNDNQNPSGYSKALGIIRDSHLLWGPRPSAQAEPSPATSPPSPIC